MDGRRERARYLLERMGVSDQADKMPATLSGGQQQRAAIARALANDPPILLADEPTGNLDSRASNQTLQFLQRSVRELGQTIVMVTHDPMAAAYANRVVLMEDGRSAGELHDPTIDAVVSALRTLGAD